MYSKNERSIVSASIFYYDTVYEEKTARQVLETLEKYNMYPPEKIYAGKLTKDKYVLASDKTKELFVNAYGEKDVFEIDMASGESRKVVDFWRIDWMLTYYKNSKVISTQAFKPWNILRVQSTYGRLQDDSNYHNFFACIKELISILSPFCVMI